MPLVFYLALALAAGIALGTRFSLTWQVLLSFWVLTLTSLLFLKRAIKARFLFIVLLFVLTGFSLIFLNQLQNKADLLVKLAKRHQAVRVTGQVKSEPKVFSSGSRFQFLIVKVQTKKLAWETHQLAQVEIEGDRKSIRLSQWLKFRSLPHLLQTGNNSSYKNYLSVQGIHVYFKLTSNQFIKLNKPRSKTEIFKASLKHKITKALPEPYGGLLLGILFGDTSKLPKPVKNDFAQSGIAHLFAVSGLNVSLIVTAVIAFGQLLKVPKKTATLLGLAAIGFYFWLVGYSPSIARASIMAALALIAWLLAREKDLIASLSWAAIVLLTVNPLTLFSISFQLSFLAVLGILLISPEINRVFQPEILSVVKPFSIVIGAQMAVQPLLAFYFNQLSIISLITNIILVPPVAIITGAGFLAILISPISSTVALIIFKILYPLLVFIRRGAWLFAHLPGAWLPIAKPSNLSIFTYLLVVASFICLLKRFKKKFGFSSFIIILLLILSLAIWGQVSLYQPAHKLEVFFLNVGQGDAILIKEPSNKTVLIDGGPDSKVLLNYLAKYHVRKIDLILATHAHADHISGLIGAISQYSVGKVLDAGFPYPSPIYKQFLVSIKSRKISYHKARQGERYQLGKLELRFYLPGNSFIENSSSDANNNSLVARAVFGNFSLLLPGDIQHEAIRLLARQKVNLKSAILKVPHHGSENGTDRLLLKAVKPRIAIISVGENNRYGHPHWQAIKLLQQFKVAILRTDRNGTIKVISNGKSYQVITTND